MTESSVFWAGTTIGDAGTYSADVFSNTLRTLLQAHPEYQAPLYQVDNGLATTNPSGTTIRVASGAAVVDGSVYTNTADVDFVVTAPGSGTNYYSIILRKDWSAQTVRLALLGPKTDDYPDGTRTWGTIWEIVIALVSITDASVVTVTDHRYYCQYNLATPPGWIDFNMFQDNNVDSSKLGFRQRTVHVMPDDGWWIDRVPPVKAQRLLSTGWGWLSDPSAPPYKETYFRGVMMIPAEYVSSSILVEAMWASHERVQHTAVLQNIVQINCFATGDGTEYDYGEIAAVIPATTGIYYPTNSLPIGTTFLDMKAIRHNDSTSDTHAGWIDFWGWRVSFYTLG